MRTPTLRPVAAVSPRRDLSSNERRKSLLKTAYKAYAAEKTEAAGWTEDKGGPRITDVRVICGDNKDIPADFGYTKIPVDLNQGAGGDFIYLTFKRESSGTPITDLKVVYAGERHKVLVPRGYERIDVDLNKGAGGEYIYLCKTYAPGLRPITDLKIIASELLHLDLESFVLSFQLFVKDLVKSIPQVCFFIKQGFQDSFELSL